MAKLKREFIHRLLDKLQELDADGIETLIKKTLFEKEIPTQFRQFLNGLSVSNKARETLQALTPKQIEKLLQKARVNANDPNKVKGFVLEELMLHHHKINSLLNDLKKIVPAKYNRNALELITEVFDPITAKGKSKGSPRELTDGIFAVFSDDGNEVLILGLIEVKAKKQAHKLTSNTHEFGGQFKQSRERIETGAIIIQGKRFEPEQIKMAADFGEPFQFVGVVPSNVSEQSIKRYSKQASIKSSWVRLEITDQEALKFAQKLIN